VPSPQGLAGHSDADVVLHAVCDALLGAAGLGDIGQLFPSSDPTYKDMDSRLLLGAVAARLSEAGWHILNIDTVIIAEQPRLSPYYAAMREAIATVLHLSADQVSIKATTPEGLGALGRAEGIAAYAVALLARADRQ